MSRIPLCKVLWGMVLMGLLSPVSDADVILKLKVPETDTEMAKPKGSMIPPEEGKPCACVWKFDFTPEKIDATNRRKSQPCIGGALTQSIVQVQAYAGYFAGRGRAYDICIGYSATDSASATSGAKLLVFRKSPSVCRGRIVETAMPVFRARAFMNPPGKAQAAGFMQVKSSRGLDVSVAGAVVSGSTTGAPIAIGPVTVSPIEKEDGTIQHDFTNSGIKMAKATRTEVLTNGSASINMIANATFLDGEASGCARVSEAKLRTEIAGECTGTTCSGGILVRWGFDAPLNYR